MSDTGALRLLGATTLGALGLVKILVPAPEATTLHGIAAVAELALAGALVLRIPRVTIVGRCIAALGLSFLLWSLFSPSPDGTCGCLGKVPLSRGLGMVLAGVVLAIGLALMAERHASPPVHRGHRP